MAKRQRQIDTDTSREKVSRVVDALRAINICHLETPRTLNFVAVSQATIGSG
jgi:hypothetical protein